MTPEQIKVFDNVVPSAGGCMVWTMSTTDGYGAFKILGTAYKSHRVALEYKLGRKINKGMQSIHSCDNRRCCNPNHLREGTNSDNMRDKAERGRVNVRGEKNPRAKLNRADVAAIRDRYAAGGVSQQKIADEYGVSQVAISKIVLKENWREW